MAPRCDNDMRGVLFEELERKSEKSPIATGTITISGVDLRIVAWPTKVVASGKAAGKKYWSLAVEYKQGTRYVLAKCDPADITVTAAKADA